MDRSIVDRLSAANSDRILRRLTAQQYLAPSAALSDSVAKVCREEGFSLSTASDALRGFVISSATSVGRLSRVQICALAQRIECVWQADLSRRMPSRQEAQA